MKTPDSHDQEFNTPAEMLTRATFVAMLASFGGGAVLIFVGAVARDAHLAVAGVLALGFAFASRGWLKQRGELEACDRALETSAQDGPPIDEGHSQELLTLLRAWEAEERKRGSAAFDPWALQALRNDIRRVVENDPALSHLFTAFQRAA